MARSDVVLFYLGVCYMLLGFLHFVEGDYRDLLHVVPFDRSFLGTMTGNGKWGTCFWGHG